MADGKPSSNLGCVLALIAFPFVVLAGIIIGLVLRDNDDGPTQASATLDEGVIDGVSWKVDAVLDVDGQMCIFLYENGDDDPLNGTCDLQPQDVTYGAQTIVFGKAEPHQIAVSVELDNGEVVDIDTTTAGEGIGGPFYVEVVEGDVNAVAVTG